MRVVHTRECRWSGVRVRVRAAGVSLVLWRGRRGVRSEPATGRVWREEESLAALHVSGPKPRKGLHPHRRRRYRGPFTSGLASAASLYPATETVLAEERFGPPVTGHRGKPGEDQEDQPNPPESRASDPAASCPGK